MKPTPIKKTEPPCRHSDLHFETGGLHVVCSNCGYAWNAVGHHPARSVVDPMARAQGLTEFDTRHQPNQLPQFNSNRYRTPNASVPISRYTPDLKLRKRSQH